MLAVCLGLGDPSLAARVPVNADEPRSVRSLPRNILQVLRVSRDSHVPTSAVEAIPIDVINLEAFGRTHEEGLERHDDLGTHVLRLRVPSSEVPVPLGDECEVGLVYECKLLSSEWDPTCPSNGRRLDGRTPNHVPVGNAESNERCLPSCLRLFDGIEPVVEDPPSATANLCLPPALAEDDARETARVVTSRLSHVLILPIFCQTSKALEE